MSNPDLPAGFPSVSVVVPARDEAASIGTVVSAIRAVGPDFEIIVVDDGSTDSTAQVADAAGARVIRHPYGLGNGAAVKSGGRAATRDVLVFLDADGQHPPESIPKLLEWIGPYDMVVGARTSESRVSRFRSAGNVLLNAFARWVTGFPISDVTSGFRAIKRKHFLEFIHLLPQRYSYPTTITIAMFSSERFVRYVPMPEIGRRKTGVSRLRPFQDGIRFLHIIVRITMLFTPLRIFLPMAIGFFISGGGLGAYQLIWLGGFRQGTGLLWQSGLMCLLLGALSEQLAELRRRPSR